MLLKTSFTVAFSTQGRCFFKAIIFTTSVKKMNFNTQPRVNKSYEEEGLYSLQKPAWAQYIVFKFICSLLCMKPGNEAKSHIRRSVSLEVCD